MIREVYGGYEAVRDTQTGELVLLPIVHGYKTPPAPRPAKRPGWWLQLLFSWDALWRR